MKVQKGELKEAQDYSAIDIGGTRIKYGLLDRAGTLIEKGDVATPNETLSEFVATIRQIGQTVPFSSSWGRV